MDVRRSRVFQGAHPLKIRGAQNIAPRPTPPPPPPPLQPLPPVTASTQATAPTAVAPAKPGEKRSAVNPMAVLALVETGTAVIEIPLLQASFGHGVTRTKIPPGCKLTLNVQVKDGKLVGGSTSSVISPPLDNILWLKGLGVELRSDNTFAVKLDPFPGTDRFGVAVNIGQAREQQLAKQMLGRTNLPRTMAELATLTLPQSSKGKKSVVDTAGITFAIDGVTLADRPLPLPDGQTITLGKGSVVKLRSRGDGGVHLEGSLNIASGEIHSDEGNVVLGAVAANASIEIGKTTTDNGPSKPVLQSLVLSDVRGELRSATQTLKTGTVVSLGCANLAAGRISLTGSTELVFSGEGANLQLQKSTLAVKSPYGVVDAEIDETVFDGGFALSSESANLNITRATTKLRLPSFQSNDGFLALSYADVEITGTGSLRYENGSLQVTSGSDAVPAYSFSGSLKDGKVGRPGGVIYADIAEQSSVSLSVSSLAISEHAVDFDAGMAVSVGIDEGRLQLGDSVGLDLKAATLVVTGVSGATGHQMHLNASGNHLSLEGSLSFKTKLTGELLAQLEKAGFSVGPMSVDGEVEVHIDGLRIGSDGRFSCERIGVAGGTTADVAVSGSIAAAKFEKLEKSIVDRLKAQIDMQKTMSDAVAPEPLQTPTTPPISELLSKVKSGVVEIGLPLPAEGLKLDQGKIGRFLDLSITPKPQPNGRPVQLRMKLVIENGKILRDQATVTIDPKDGLNVPIGWDDGRFYLTADGHLFYRHDTFDDTFDLSVLNDDWNAVSFGSKPLDITWWFKFPALPELPGDLPSYVQGVGIRLNNIMDDVAKVFPDLKRNKRLTPRDVFDQLVEMGISVSMHDVVLVDGPLQTPTARPAVVQPCVLPLPGGGEVVIEPRSKLDIDWKPGSSGVTVKGDVELVLRPRHEELDGESAVATFQLGSLLVEGELRVKGKLALDVGPDSLSMSIPKLTVSSQAVTLRDAASGAHLQLGSVAASGSLRYSVQGDTYDGALVLDVAKNKPLTIGHSQLLGASLSADAFWGNLTIGFGAPPPFASTALALHGAPATLNWTGHGKNLVVVRDGVTLDVASGQAVVDVRGSGDSDLSFVIDQDTATFTVKNSDLDLSLRQSKLALQDLPITKDLSIDNLSLAFNKAAKVKVHANEWELRAPMPKMDLGGVSMEQNLAQVTPSLVDFSSMAFDGTVAIDLPIESGSLKIDGVPPIKLERGSKATLRSSVRYESGKPVPTMQGALSFTVKASAAVNQALALVDGVTLRAGKGQGELIVTVKKFKLDSSGRFLLDQLGFSFDLTLDASGQIVLPKAPAPPMPALPSLSMPTLPMR